MVRKLKRSLLEPNITEREVLALYKVSATYKSRSTLRFYQNETNVLNIETMKFAIVSLFALVALASAAPAAEQTAKPIAILRSSEDGPNPDGSYAWSYETENGIQAEEKGQFKQLARTADSDSDGAISAQGSFSYTADDGTPISLSYIADENGFQPQGAHLPVAPEVPQAILRALEWIANHPEEDKLTK